MLAAEQRVIAVMKFAEGGSSGVRPPRVLQDTERVGFSDILVDPGGVVRRGLLFLDDGATVSYSFPLRLALLYLQAHDVVPQADPRDPSHLRLGRVTIPPLESDDGGYVDADARGYQFLLDFKGARRPFRSVDLASLLAGSFDPGLFRDRIVLIGVVAESIEDDFYTPFSRGLGAQQSMPGVAIHAQVASQLLQDGARRRRADGRAARVAGMALDSALERRGRAGGAAGALAVAASRWLQREASSAWARSISSPSWQADGSRSYRRRLAG